MGSREPSKQTLTIPPPAAGAWSTAAHTLIDSVRSHSRGDWRRMGRRQR